MMKSFQEILEAAKQGAAKKLVVPFPGRADIDVLSKAAALGLILPRLIGDAALLEAMLGDVLPASGKWEVVDEKNQERALNRAIALVREGEYDILMQGGITHQALTNAVLHKNSGLKIKKGRTISYISVFQVSQRDKLTLITDTYIHNQPTLIEKQMILENALKLDRVLGVDEPRVAALSSIELVNPSIPSTVDAAVLSKMSERGQFGKAVVEGPIDIDCALSQVAATRKGLKSVVTGNVNIYLVPEVDTGRLMTEALIFFGKLPMAGVVMGTAKPVITNLPFVSDENRVVEIALASLICRKGVNNE
ncbi:MAG: phosphate acyltransferase [Smithellaceae bacterium]